MRGLSSRTRTRASRPSACPGPRAGGVRAPPLGITRVAHLGRRARLATQFRESLAPEPARVASLRESQIRVQDHDVDEPVVGIEERDSTPDLALKTHENTRLKVVLPPEDDASPLWIEARRVR